jgi:hypothetical protein
MPVLSQGKNEEEFEKRLGASLLADDACINIDKQNGRNSSLANAASYGNAEQG